MTTFLGRSFQDHRVSEDRFPKVQSEFLQSQLLSVFSWSPAIERSAALPLWWGTKCLQPLLVNLALEAFQHLGLSPLNTAWFSLNVVVPRAAHSAWGGAAPVQHRVGRSPALIISNAVPHVPGHGRPFWLSGYTFNSYSTCHQTNTQISFHRAAFPQSLTPQCLSTRVCSPVCRKLALSTSNTRNIVAYWPNWFDIHIIAAWKSKQICSPCSSFRTDSSKRLLNFLLH